MIQQTLKMYILSAEESGQIDLLRRQYLQLLEPGLLTFPPAELLKRPDVQHLLYHNMFNTENPMFAPTGRYQLRVLKELVRRIETAFTDPEEDVGFPNYLNSRYLLCFRLAARLSCQRRDFQFVFMD